MVYVKYLNKPGTEVLKLKKKKKETLVASEINQRFIAASWLYPSKWAFPCFENHVCLSSLFSIFGVFLSQGLYHLMSVESHVLNNFHVLFPKSSSTAYMSILQVRKLRYRRFSNGPDPCRRLVVGLVPAGGSLDRLHLQAEKLLLLPAWGVGHRWQGEGT